MFCFNQLKNSNLSLNFVTFSYLTTCSNSLFKRVGNLSYLDVKEWLYDIDEEDLFGEDEDIWDPSEYDLEIEKEMFDDVLGEEE